MNVIKKIERLVQIKNEIRKMRQTLEFQEKELDGIAGELVEFLMHKKIIEPRC
jgi:cell division protein FtsL